MTNQYSSRYGFVAENARDNTTAWMASRKAIVAMKAKEWNHRTESFRDKALRKIKRVSKRHGASSTTVLYYIFFKSQRDALRKMLNDHVVSDLQNRGFSVDITNEYCFGLRRYAVGLNVRW